LIAPSFGARTPKPPNSVSSATAMTNRPPRPPAGTRLLELTHISRGTQLATAVFPPHSRSAHGRIPALPVETPNALIAQTPESGDIRMAAITEQTPGDIGQITAIPELSRRHHLTGAALVVLSTAAIAIVPSFARLAYDGGSDTLTVIAGRCIATATVCFLVTAILGRPLRIPRRSLAISLGLGVLYAVHLYGLLGAVTYLPVNMAILIYFLHPLMIGLAAMFAGRETASLLRLGALVVAVVGLALAVRFSLGGLSLLGVALASLAAVLAAVIITSSAVAMRNSDSLTVTSYMMLSAALCLSSVSLAHGDVKLPTTGQGWLGFGGVALWHTIGTLTFFGAIPLLGAVRAAMITNLEPALGILFAMFILGERMSPVQGTGIALVIVSIFAMEMTRPTARSVLAGLGARQ